MCATEIGCLSHPGISKYSFNPSLTNALFCVLPTCLTKGWVWPWEGGSAQGLVIKHTTPVNGVPVVSHGAPLAIGYTNVQTSPSMTWLWRHNRCHVKNSENCPKSSKPRVFAIFVTKIRSFVVAIGVRVHLDMAFVKLNSIKYKLCKYFLTKTWKISFFVCFFFQWKVQAGSQWPPTFDFWRDIMTSLKVFFPH